MNHNNGLLSVHPIELATVIGGRSMSPASNLPMSVMTVLDNPGRALNRAMDSVGAGNNTREGQTYSPASSNKDGSINQGHFQPGPSPVPASR